jgi:hypothetical protein
LLALSVDFLPPGPVVFPLSGSVFGASFAKERAMNDRVILAEALGPRPFAQAARIHHRNFPENWAEAETPLLAANQLVLRLRRELDSTAGDRRRGSLVAAIADVEEVLQELVDADLVSHPIA